MSLRLNWLNGSQKYRVDFAYLIGVMLGDGFFSNVDHTKIIGLRTTEREFAVSFQNCLMRLGYSPRWGETNSQKGTPLYQVRLTGKELVAYFKLLEMDDLRKLIGTDRELIILILKGFYESEGCVGYLSRKKNNRARGYRIRMGCSLKEIVEYIFELTKLLDYNCNFRDDSVKYKNRIANQYRIYISRKSEVIRFFKEINPCIKRTIRSPFTDKQRERVKQYNEVLELSSSGLSYLEISRRLKVPETTVWYWIKKVEKPRCLSKPEIIVL